MFAPFYRIFLASISLYTFVQDLYKRNFSFSSFVKKVHLNVHFLKFEIIQLWFDNGFFD